MSRLSPALMGAVVGFLASVASAHAGNAFFLDPADGGLPARASAEPDPYADPAGDAAAYAPSDADIQPMASPIPRELVSYDGPYPAGTIVVSTTEKRLYLVLPDHQALRYGVGVGRPGFAWSGSKTITAKREWPGWTPPAAMLRRRPDLPRHMEGGLDNPLGARAMYLGSSEFRIHGSNEPDTIGRAVSSGCIRMTNDDVADLYDRVKVGTRAIVAP
ncbi:L,D-transpeptidase [Lichenihabitans sp. Uapishka_5]|uniref:L,D-transpeptidase n=1 Tax=Lichenihabitans sp. Uapishka_5 TaxID=3037302 RepID=UPI0029E7FB52|nr:L,D-transpeptidase [Lichenihabitans sp. Uapishka_5]MDX7949879.1 L,D-transpeptidase [Lichenihabitans sp. Uapishka_5]